MSWKTVPDLSRSFARRRSKLLTSTSSALYPDVLTIIDRITIRGVWQVCRDTRELRITCGQPHALEADRKKTNTLPRESYVLQARLFITERIAL